MPAAGSVHVAHDTATRHRRGLHLPGLLFLNYHSGSRLRSTIFFSIMAISMSIIMAHLRKVSGRLWTGAVFHASHNLAIQGIFNHFTVETSQTKFFAGEFGMGLAVVYSIVAVWFWRRMSGQSPEQAR